MAGMVEIGFLIILVFDDIDVYKTMPLLAIEPRHIVRKQCRNN
jgi:hypothetical protein